MGQRRTKFMPFENMHKLWFFEILHCTITQWRFHRALRASLFPKKRIAFRLNHRILGQRRNSWRNLNFALKNTPILFLSSTQACPPADYISRIWLQEIVFFPLNSSLLCMMHISEKSFGKKNGLRLPCSPVLRRNLLEWTSCCSTSFLCLCKQHYITKMPRSQIFGSIRLIKAWLKSNNVIK